MSVKRYTTTVYVCICDKCGNIREVERKFKIYNSAQAVRSLGWSFGKDGSIFCTLCRKRNMNDRYR